jgi:hypothetical protein
MTGQAAHLTNETIAAQASQTETVGNTGEKLFEHLIQTLEEVVDSTAFTQAAQSVAVAAPVTKY